MPRVGSKFRGMSNKTVKLTRLSAIWMSSEREAIGLRNRSLGHARDLQCGPIQQLVGPIMQGEGNFKNELGLRHV